MPDCICQSLVSSNASSSTKTSLDTHNGCDKCLDYQPLKDLEMERMELRKTKMDCVENCGDNNLSLSKVMARVFSLKALLTIYVGNEGIYSIGEG